MELHSKGHRLISGVTDVPRSELQRRCNYAERGGERGPFHSQPRVPFADLDLLSLVCSSRCHANGSERSARKRSFWSAVCFHRYQSCPPNAPNAPNAPIPPSHTHWVRGWTCLFKVGDLQLVICVLVNNQLILFREGTRSLTRVELRTTNASYR